MMMMMIWCTVLCVYIYIYCLFNHQLYIDRYMLSIFSHHQFNRPRTQNGLKHRTLMFSLQKRCAFEREVAFAAPNLSGTAPNWCGATSDGGQRCFGTMKNASHFLTADSMMPSTRFGCILDALCHGCFPRKNWWCWDGSVPGRNQRPWFRDSPDPGSHLVRTFGGEVELMMWGKAWNGPKVIREETFSAQFGIDIDVGSGPAKPGGCDIQMRTLDGAYSTGSRI